MKIPKYIDEALKKRTKAAFAFNEYDYIVSEWITKNGLDEDIDGCHIYGGCESIVNPSSSEATIRDAILQK